MTEAKSSVYPADWKAVARKDWHRMTVLLEDGDPDGAAFFLQQSLEKYFKAYLLEKGWKSGYYYTERYPLIVPSELTTEDIKRDRIDAERLIKYLFAEESIASFVK